MRGWHFKDTLVWCPVCNKWQSKRAGWFCWNWHRLPDNTAQQNAHPTLGESAASTSVILLSEVSASEGVSS